MQAGLQQEDRENIVSIMASIDWLGFDEHMALRLIRSYCDGRLAGSTPDDAYSGGMIKAIREELIHQRTRSVSYELVE